MLAAGVAVPPTAAVISAEVASSTKRFWEKIQPSVSSATSHVFPLPVLSFKLPGLKVPDLSASWGSPPTAVICFASSSTIALLVAAALEEAGSCTKYIVSKKNARWIYRAVAHLMLLDGSNLRIDSLETGACIGRETDFASVALQRTIDQGSDLTVHVVGSFGVSECLVCSRLLQAVQVLLRG